MLFLGTLLSVAPCGTLYLQGTTLEEGAPWYPGSHVCATTLEEDKCQFHII